MKNVKASWLHFIAGSEHVGPETIWVYRNLLVVILMITASWRLVPGSAILETYFSPLIWHFNKEKGPDEIPRIALGALARSGDSVKDGKHARDGFTWLRVARPACYDY